VGSKTLDFLLNEKGIEIVAAIRSPEKAAKSSNRIRDSKGRLCLCRMITLWGISLIFGSLTNYIRCLDTDRPMGYMRQLSMRSDV